MKRRRAGLFLFVLLTSLGNAPHPSAFCVGKVAGDPCKTNGYGGCSSDGVCKLQPDCTDYPESPANECLICD